MRLRVAALLAIVIRCYGQETPSFRTSGNLIEFTLVARDSKGQPVADLRKEEISILENGKPRTVAVFRFEDNAARKGPVKPMPPGVFTNRPEYSAAPASNIAAGSGLAVARREATASWQSAQSIRDEQDRERRQKAVLAAMEALGDRLAGIPGHRSIVWAGSGMPLATRAGGNPARRDRGWPVDLAPEFGKTMKRLAAQQGAVYPVRPLFGEHQDGSAWDLRATMELVADATGGRAVEGMNDLSRAVTAAEEDAPSAWTIGFYAQDEPDNAWHDVRVRVSRPRAAVIANPVPLAAVRMDAQCTFSDQAEEIAWQITRSSMQWKAGADTRTIRLIARDRASGRYGTVDVPVGTP